MIDIKKFNNYKIIIDNFIILWYNVFVVKENTEINKNEKTNIKEKKYEKRYKKYH